MQTGTSHKRVYLKGRAMDDAEVLERAAQILTARSTKPKSTTLRALCGVLRDTAAKIRAEDTGIGTNRPTED